MEETRKRDRASDDAAGEDELRQTRARVAELEADVARLTGELYLALESLRSSHNAHDKTERELKMIRKRTRESPEDEWHEWIKNYLAL